MTDNDAQNQDRLDLLWTDDDVVPDVVYPDLEFLFQQMLDLTLEEVAPRQGELILDIGCGKAVDGAHLSRSGALVVGVEPSQVMLQRARGHLSEHNAHVLLAQGIGENLPFKSNTFDKAMCKGALDHFLSPSRTMDEIARVLKPGGEMVISIANFESLGFRVGKRLYPVTRHLCRLNYTERKPWEPPPDHLYKFDYPFLTALAKARFTIRRKKGISLLFGLPMWGSFLNRLPRSLSFAILRLLDKLARPLPSLADVIVIRCSPLRTVK